MSNEWENFDLTENENTRFCKQCKKNVHLCHTEEDAKAHAKELSCIGFTRRKT
jgi:hypothetical protein